MNVVIARDSVKASKIEIAKCDDRFKDENENSKTENKGVLPVTDHHKENIATTDGPMREINSEMLQRQYEETLEANRLLKKQLESRDRIVKTQISEIHRLQGENKIAVGEKDEFKKEAENLKKELESEKWLGERLKHDVRDLQMQLDFQDCYLQEQSHQSGLMESLLNELQKRNDAQQKEIIELKEQLQTAKERLDNQIMDLQKMLGIQACKGN